MRDLNRGRNTSKYRLRVERQHAGSALNWFWMGKRTDALVNHDCFYFALRVNHGVLFRCLGGFGKKWLENLEGADNLVTFAG